ncbi:MAG TPA: preprotein translocase subunit SecY [Thermoguttaceae bacterium]|nr:preprotein translocase subunit SecY [Thermoguttaceae bacterium]
MWEKIRVVFTIPELRQKILLTLGLLAIYRIGWQIPLPIVDPDKMTQWAKDVQGAGGLGALVEQVAIFSASQLSQATIFGLGIMPYISASIIFQLLATVWPPLEKLQKEGESGRKKINEYTRYATVLLCVFQSWFYMRILVGNDLVRDSFLAGVPPNQYLPFFWQLTAVLTMTAGTTFLMWLGEQIDEYGIGNGISLLIMAGILARMPSAGWQLLRPMVRDGLELGSSGGQTGVDKLLVLAAMFVAVVAGVVLITQGQRRIPTQSAKHVRGRRVYGGTRQYLPLRVNQAGVMPIIFASSLLLFPQVLFQLMGNLDWGDWDFWRNLWHTLDASFRRGESYLYNLMYIGLIYFFCYFWTAITFNPKDMADNLKNYGTFIPGHRPGKRTADYLEKVMVRITYVGAGFLAVVAIFPTLVATWMGVDWGVASFFGGTALLIAVSVAFDLVQKIDSHLVMRNYKGLLEK